MRFRGILFLATLALTLSPGAGALADIGQSDSTFEHAFPRRNYYQSLGTGFSGTVTDFSTFVRRTSAPANVGFNLCEFSDATYGSAAAIGCDAMGQYITVNAKTLVTDSTDSVLGPMTPIVLNSGSFYLIFMTEVGINGSTFLYGSDDVNAYLNGESRRDGGVTLGFDDFGVAFNTVFNGLQGDIFFNLVGASVGPVNEIIVPFDGETITAVPFQIQGTCDQAEEPNVRVVITHADLGFIEERVPVCIADSWAAPNMGAALFNDDFIVTLNADNFVELPFDTHDFTVDEPGNPNPGPPQAGVQCSGVSNLFLEGLCDILSFLFVPSSQVLQGVENLFDELKEKPPLGFLTVALDAFNDLEQGTSSEVLEGTATLSSYFDAIKATFSAILWLLFAVFLVRRVSTIRI